MEPMDPMQLAALCEKWAACPGIVKGMLLEQHRRGGHMPYRIVQDDKYWAWWIGLGGQRT